MYHGEGVCWRGGCLGVRNFASLCRREVESVYTEVWRKHGRVIVGLGHHGLNYFKVCLVHGDCLGPRSWRLCARVCVWGGGGAEEGNLFRHE